MLSVCSFESRKREEMASLIRRHGGEPTVVPSMQEVPLENNRAALQFAERLLAGDVDVVVWMTGVGAAALLEAVETKFNRAEFLAALKNTAQIARGPKPLAVLRGWGTPPDHTAGEPNTWREVLDVVKSRLAVSGQTVAIQEYGVAGPELTAALEALGAKALPVPIYRWELPDDVGPLETAVRETIAGTYDLLLFTSANQLNNILDVAVKLGLRDQWLDAAKQCVIASIGPTTSERLRSSGLQVDLEPTHPKMGHLVAEAIPRAKALLL